jgi:hypothetical protein
MRYWSYKKFKKVKFKNKKRKISSFSNSHGWHFESFSL